MSTGLDADTLTTLIGQVSSGDRTALDRLFSLLYDELRGIAEGLMRKESAGHTLQATAIVHEAYGRLSGSRSLSITDRPHFFKLSAKVIRQVLLDHAKAKNRKKRGGDADQVRLDTAIISPEVNDIDIEALHQSLEDLAALSPRQAQIVEWKFFAGMTTEDMAGLLGVSPRTVEGEWTVAKIWLGKRLNAAGSKQ
ncbi:MAG: sigma-70 family RNA polymerase sigma factor [Phycisphaerales bacterium]|nr:sigma-70 family RNA polymerase sigma factor [Phycisphaerales bacterium]